MDISIHAPVKGATFSLAGRISCNIDFNPRTREGCDAGRTRIPAADVLISIHAPVKGATKSISDVRDIPIYFNPRTREGCDAVDDRAVGLVGLISIHAPVKGATILRKRKINRWI